MHSYYGILLPLHARQMTSTYALRNTKPYGNATRTFEALN